MQQKHYRFTLSCLVVINMLLMVYTLLYSDQQKLTQNSHTITLEKNDYRKLHECLQVTNSNMDQKPLRSIISQPVSTNANTKDNNIKEEGIKVSLQLAKEPKCANEKTNIAFLKTHKTASSTITNIIQRFGFYRNLTFVLPFKRLNQTRYNYIGGQGDTISRDNIIPKMANDTYNILCNHVVYNATSFEDILPNNTFLFTIIREPFSQFISALNYYGSAKQGYMLDFLNSNMSNPLHEYLQTPQKWEPTDPHYSMTNNKMSVDLGMPIDHIRNRNLIKSYIQILKEKFQLVLLKEYFDESLILLKRHTCWSFKDIIYISHNTWSKRRKFNLSPEDIDKHRKWNKADYTLYETFYEIFWDKIVQEKDFFREVYNFKQIQRKVSLHCIQNNLTKTLTIHRSKWNPEFTVSPDDCFYIEMSEGEFVRDLHNDMLDRYDPFHDLPF